MRAVNPRDYYHPQDRKALQELQQIPGFSAVMKAFMKMFSEQMIQGMNMSNKVRIGPDQLPELYRLLPPICEVLGIREMCIRDRRYTVWIQEKCCFPALILQKWNLRTGYLKN